MAGLVVACVRVGDKYSADYVDRLYNGVKRHLNVPFTFVVVGDATYPGRPYTTMTSYYPNWWSKMVLFGKLWRHGRRVIGLDLDTVVCGPLDHLAEIDDPLAICGSFVRAAGHSNWPCAYGSCVMVLNDSLGNDAFAKFLNDPKAVMKKHEQYGDQKFIEEVYPKATILQDVLPDGFFLNYRNLPGTEGPGPASLVIFGGKNKPDNCNVKWVKEEWRS